MLKSLGHLIEEAATDRVAVRLMERNPINLVLASVDPGDADALELLSYVRRKYADVPVILMFPRVHAERAKEALRLGAMAVLKYPVPAAELRAAVLQALEEWEARPDEAQATPAAGFVGPNHSSRPAVAVQALTEPPIPDNGLPNGLSPSSTHPGPGPAGPVTSVPPLSAVPSGSSGRVAPSTRTEAVSRELDLITADPCMRQIVELAGTLALTPATVLIVGEPGTGKSLLAQVLHLGGGHTDRPFVTLKCSGFAEAGPHVEADEAVSSGDSTGMAEWSTKLNQARGGTFHVQEVGALPAELQLQLLRELQIHDIEAAAGHSRMPGRADVRYVLSSSDNLPALIEQGKFRSDLYHRISTICLMVPPLRLRGADIELLAEHFRTSFSQEFRKNVVGFSRDALDVLQRHEWPANVRELKGVIRRAAALCSGPRITSSHLAPILNPHRQSRGGAANAPRPHLPIGIRPLKEALEEPEKRIIIQALQALNWNRQETARVLDINRTTLYKKMKKYGLLLDEPIWVN
jgi:two-component system response regulator HydG